MYRLSKNKKEKSVGKNEKEGYGETEGKKGELKKGEKRNKKRPKKNDTKNQKNEKKKRKKGQAGPKKSHQSRVFFWFQTSL